MSSIADRVAALVVPLLELLPTDPAGAPGVQLYDVEYEGGVLRIVLDRPGGLDVGLLAEATRSISVALDDADPIESSYTLEVSSPGIERRLRTATHFAAAVGEQVQLKVRPGSDGDRRAQGELISADDTTIVLRDAEGAERRVAIADITRANVHKDWSPPPKPGARKGGAAKPSTNEPTTNEPTTRSETSS